MGNRVKRVLKWIALALSAVILCTLVFCSVLFLSIEDFAHLDMARILKADESTVLYDHQGNAVRTLFSKENRIWVEIESIPKEVQLAFVAAEDARFYQHHGLDLKRILGALWADLKAGDFVEGASTITQQLIKNSHLSRSKTIIRKLEEAFLAIKLEQAYSKDDILEMYLNYVYFGSGAYGIQAASRRYFQKDAFELSLAEGASLAAIVKSPGSYAPHLEPENNKGRRDVILGLMEQYGFIDGKTASAAKSEPLTVQIDQEKGQFGWYTDAALTEACSLLNLSLDDLLTGGYRIYTELDPSIQTAAEEAYANDGLFPKDAADGTPVESALIVADSKTGGVRAIIGGRRREVEMGFHRATSLKRSPGSAIKPILVYLPAIVSGRFTGASLLLDEASTFDGYSPKNFDGEYNGAVTLRYAVEQSLNVPAVDLMNRLGIEYCKAFASSMGIPFTPMDHGLSLALGGFSTGVSPMDLCGAYTTLANLGYYSPCRIISKIEDRNGNTLYSAGQNSRRIVSESAAFLMTDILQSTVEEGNCGNLFLEDVPLAGKSGTHGYTVGNRDAWMAAYNPEYTMVCYMGFDQTDEDHHLPSSVTGGTYPAKLCKAVFTAIYRSKTAPDFTQPSGVAALTLDSSALKAGVLRRSSKEDAITEYFDPTTLPAILTTPAAEGTEPIQSFDAVYQSPGRVEVSFCTGDDSCHYRLLRRSEQESDYGTIATIPPGMGAAVYYDDTAQSRIGYTYYMEAIDATGTCIYQSERVFVAPAS